MHPKQSSPLNALTLALILCAPAAAQSPLLPQGLPGQAPAETARSAQPAPEAPPASAVEIVTRSRLLGDSAAEAERTVARLTSVSGLRAEVAEATQRQQEIQALLASLIDAEHVRVERLSRVRDQALLEDQRLEGLRTRVFERLDQLGELRGRWLERQRLWRSWRQALRADPDYGLVASDMADALARIDTVLTRSAGALAELVELQRAVEQLRLNTEQISSEVLAVRSARRGALLRRNEPVLLSAAHRAELASARLEAWQPLSLLQPTAYFAFFRDHAGVILLHLLVVLLIGLAARRLSRTMVPEGGWGGTLAHPWALGVLIATAAAMQRVTLAPPLWDVLLWVLFGGAAALLAGRVMPTRALRITVFLLGIIYPLLLLLESLQLPAPILRMVFVAVAAIALPVFAAAARRRTAAALADEDRDPRRLWPLRIGALLWAVVLVAVALGYDALGRWVLHATIMSAAVVFVVIVLFVVVRGALATLVRIEGRERARVLRTVGVPLARRLMLLVQLLLVATTTLVLLDVWEITGSPLSTWRRIVGASLPLGPLQLTVGRLLTGAVVVYVAVSTSWLLRTIMQTEAYRRWHFDRGVGDSINRLVHYTLVAVGVLVALAVLGVELQNFAIIMGALGIGIGFGLQNVVNNFVSGLILLFERPVRVGDTVVVDGEWGTIRKIGLRSTIMLTFDQSEMIVPNADLVSEKVTNWTLSNPVARVILPVGVAYGSRIDEVLQILREAGQAHDSVLADPPPQALFVGFGDSSLDFELRVWVREIRLRLEVRSTVLTDVERRLTAAGIEIPFPQRDLHVRSVDANATRALLGRTAGEAD